jgi:hypothetical protein
MRLSIALLRAGQQAAMVRARPNRGGAMRR